MVGRTQARCDGDYTIGFFFLFEQKVDFGAKLSREDTQERGFIAKVSLVVDWLGGL